MLQQSPYTLIKAIVDAINKTVVIDAVNDNNDGTFTLATCNTKWLSPGFPVTIGGKKYTVKSIEDKTSITVKGTDAITAASFEAYPPVFYYGTLRTLEEEITKPVSGSQSNFNKLPMVWLHTAIKENQDIDPVNMAGNELDLELYFCTDADMKWTNQNHLLNAVFPMRNLADEFLKAASTARNVNFSRTKALTAYELPKFSAMLSTSGGTKSATSMNLSGFKLELPLTFNKINSYCCK